MTTFLAATAPSHSEKMMSASPFLPPRLRSALQVLGVFCFLGFPYWYEHKKQSAARERSELAAECSARAPGALDDEWSRKPTRASSAIQEIYLVDPDVARALALDCGRAETLWAELERECERFARESKFPSDSPSARSYARKVVAARLSK